MDDARVWDFERSLWVGDAERYEALIEPDCLMVLPEKPHVLTGEEAIEAVKRTPRWSEVTFSKQQVARPQEGLIVLAYEVAAKRADEGYTAYCTTTLRRLEHENWQVVQHQQTIALAEG